MKKLSLIISGLGLLLFPVQNSSASPYWGEFYWTPSPSYQQLEAWLSFTGRDLPNSVSGSDPVTGEFSTNAWTLVGSHSGRTRRFLVENPSKDEDPSKAEIREWLHSFSIPQQSTPENARRYVWSSYSTPSAAASSGIYIIPASSYTSFMNGSAFSRFAKSTNMSAEIRLPAGSYHVVAINTSGSTNITAGWAASQIFSYRRSTTADVGAPAPALSDTEQTIEMLQDRVVRIRRVVRNPRARTLEIRRLNMQIERLRATL